MKTYIFGYGSLINQDSRKSSTNEMSPAIPAKIEGLTKGWFARTGITSLSTTFLGCIESNSQLLKDVEHSTNTNGVLYEVDPKQLGNLDQREKNYIRTKIDKSRIRFYGNEISENSEVYTYLNHFERQKDFINSSPNKEFPIVQSYVDLCINGCFQIEERYKEARDASFLYSFINDCIFWSDNWVNDRIMPRRAHMYEPNANRIDIELKKILPNFFSNIYIE